MRTATENSFNPLKLMPLKLVLIMVFCGLCNLAVYMMGAHKIERLNNLLKIANEQRLHAEELALYSYRFATKPDFQPYRTDLIAVANGVNQNYYAIQEKLAAFGQTGSGIYLRKNAEINAIENRLVSVVKAFAEQNQAIINDNDREIKAQQIFSLARDMITLTGQSRLISIEARNYQRMVQEVLLFLSLILSFLLIFWITYRNFCERLKTSLAAAEKRRIFLQEVVDSSFDAIISIDKNQRITLFNKEAENLFGYPAAEIAGQSIDTFIPMSYRGQHAAMVEGFNEGTVKSKYMGKWRTVSALTRDGVEFPVVAKITRHEVGGGEFYSTVAIRDMRETVRQEKLISQNIREIEWSNSRMKAFFAQFTHEMRTPLNIIIGFNELALFGLAHAPQEQTAQYLGHVAEAAKNLDGLILEVLDYRSIDEMLEDGKPVLIDAIAIMKEVAHRIVSRGGGAFEFLSEIKSPLMVYGHTLILDRFFSILFDLMISKTEGNIRLVAGLADNQVIFNEENSEGKSLLYEILEQLERVRDLQFDDVIQSSSPFEIRILTLLKLSEACRISVAIDKTILQGGRITFNSAQLPGLKDGAGDKGRESIIDWASKGRKIIKIDLSGRAANAGMRQSSGRGKTKG